jgi:hypothetical protein
LEARSSGAIPRRSRKVRMRFPSSAAAGMDNLQNDGQAQIVRRLLRPLIVK